jgi:hypothetical protein
VNERNSGPLARKRRARPSTTKLTKSAERRMKDNTTATLQPRKHTGHQSPGMKKYLMERRGEDEGREMVTDKLLESGSGRSVVRHGRGFLV